MTEREIWEPSNCGYCVNFVGVVLGREESDREAKVKSFIGSCEWREGLAWGGETPSPNCGCMDRSFLRGVSFEVSRRRLGGRRIKEIEERLNNLMLQRAGLFLGE